MDTIDGTPLSPQARANLQKLMQVAAAAQAKAAPSDRTDQDDLATSILDAFKRMHQVRGGKWVPRAVVRLAGGALVAPNG